MTLKPILSKYGKTPYSWIVKHPHIGGYGNSVIQRHSVSDGWRIGRDGLCEPRNLPLIGFQTKQMNTIEYERTLLDECK
jgi:hypothetical protein